MDVIISKPVGLGVSSTGRRPVNLPKDVETIQLALNLVPANQGGANPKLAITKTMDAATHQAIRRFQQRQLGFQDGVVDTDKITIQRLRTFAGGGAGRSQIAPSRDEGEGGGGDFVIFDVNKALADAKAATRKGVNDWKSAVTITGTVSALSAFGFAGCVSSPSSFEGPLAAAVRGAGGPEAFATGCASTVFGSWKRFWDAYTIPGLPWYPRFAAMPGPSAPPTPNVPSLAVLGVSGGSGGMTAGALALTMRSNAGASQSVIGVSTFTDQYTQWFSSNFFSFLGSHSWTNVLGSGPIPTFAPPYVPVGPVVGGTFTGSPGCFVGPGFIIP